MVNKSRKLLLEKMKKVLDLTENKLDINDKEYWDALNSLNDEIRDLPTEVSWLLPKERLPQIRELDKNCCVLATTENGEVSKVKFNTMIMDFSPGDNVVAWMPLPKAYSDIVEVFRKFFGKK